MAAPEPESIDEGALDRSADPCQDFYRFACGGWVEKTTIPPDRPAWFRSFSEIDEQTQAALKTTLEGLPAAPADPVARKLKDFYVTCMDESQTATGSRQTLDALLQKIEAVKDKHALAPLVAELSAQGVDALFGFGAIQDFKDAQQMIGGADQGGLGLPDRDYYLKKDPASRKILKAYGDHMARMLVLLGRPKSKAAAQARVILAIETKLASASMDKVLRRQPENIYHRLNRPGLAALAPSFDWAGYFATLGRPHIEAINVMSPDFFSGVETLLKATPLADVKLYLQWQTVAAAAPALSAPFVEEAFSFRQILAGEETILPRWKRCLDAIESGMGQALGKSFVEATFSAQGKQAALDLVGDIEAAFARNLNTLTWMDDKTRSGAREKLERVYNKIGYPDKWRSYDALEIGRQSDLANRLAAAAFETKRDLAKIGEPIDRTEWHMPPHAVNAYYDALMNEMVFPAGILQPPFFDARRSGSANFGAVGMVMGHELTHGFDDEGRKFDEVGNLRDWWSPEAAQQFESRTKCVVDQYAKYKVAPDVPVNGELTVGENIADIGGLKLAHAAWNQQRAADDVRAADGFTPPQRFFIAFAQSWCAKRREPYVRLMVTVDPHAPPEFRVNGSVTNHPAFATAFACPAGAAMAPERRCEVW